jgi:NADPH-dependent 2,4-dienoyl-CoA reductase/sulfur reductase-like enzyme
MVDRLVVIGGDAAGMAAASQARRLRPQLEIVALERGHWTSYSACGIPYLVAGDIDEIDQLVARSPQELRSRFRIDVRLQQEAVAIDVDRRVVEVRDHGHDRTYPLAFDQLMVGTGARPLRPDLPGIGSDHVRGVQTLEDAAALLEAAKRSKCENVVVVGGGYIGLEMAEAFHRWGAQVTLVEGSDAVMRTLDPDMSVHIVSAMRDLGVDVRLGEPVKAFEPGSVTTGSGRLPADLVVLGLGVTPNGELAGDAGVKLGARGAIEVDARQRTSVEGVWAAGDCADTWHRVTRRRVHIALGTVANKTARIAGVNIGGGYARFPGVVGTAITKICGTEVARSGLTEHEAQMAGFEYATASIETTTTAGYFPSAEKMRIKMLAERGTGRVLGAQIVGGAGSAKRIDTVATAITAEMDVAEVLELDLAYAPPFSSVWDPVQAVARKLAPVL